jgi:polyhydroxybutyrate depolymerase
MPGWFVALLGLLAVSAAGAEELQRMEVTVNGTPRTALVHVPARAHGTPTPLVFVFHGHGGSAEQAARSFHLHQLWPEAIVVYPQGLPTPGTLTDPAGNRAGWQRGPGDEGDRDLAFFDALLGRLESELRVDARRVYVTGHSNGGAFTYLLWLERPGAIAAVAPSAAAAGFARRLAPMPALILGGRRDPLVKFRWQGLTMRAVRRVNGCSETGEPWAGGAGTLYPSSRGAPLVTCIFDGGHRLDPAEPALIARFFEERAGGAALRLSSRSRP